MLSLKPFQEAAPGVLEVREGSGFIYIFGLPFLAAEVFVTLIGTRVVRTQNASELPWWAWRIVLFMGLAFVAAGSARVFGRTLTRLEVRRRYVGWADAENRIKELGAQFGMQGLCCQSFWATEATYHLALAAYNLCVLLQQRLGQLEKGELITLR